MADQESLWYRVGYGLEHARGAALTGPRLRSLAERRDDKVASRPSTRPADGDGGKGDEGYDAVLAALAAALGSQALRLVPARRRPGLGRLLRAGAAGAGAAVLREVVRPLLAGGRAGGRPLQEAVRDAAVAGSARGLLYGALVEPRLPGPTVVRGLLFGYVESLASPWGGLTRLAGRSAPHRRVPVLSALYDDLPPEEDTLVDHLVYGAALAVLYGAADHDGED